MEISGNCGYDEEFVDPPAEYLKCVVCCLVLRRPVQIATCGHRYCLQCYDRIKGFAEHHNVLFTCPVDRKEIDETKVLDDMGMARIVLDLGVKCSCHMHGCEWSGELRELGGHQNCCPYVQKQLPQDSIDDDNALLLSGMCDRVEKCEESLLEKEKELGHIKLLLQQLQEKVDQREGGWKNKELQQLQEKVDRREEGWNLLNTKNIEMEKKIVSLEEANKELREDLANAVDRVQRLEVEKEKRDQENVKTQIDLKSQFKGMQSKTDKSLNDINEQLQKINLAPLVQLGAKKISSEVHISNENPETNIDKKKNAHLYMNVQVVQENSFQAWSGNDLFDPDSMKPYNLSLLKKTKIEDAKKAIAESLGYTEAQCRLWTFVLRANGTSRPGPIEIPSANGSEDTSRELFTINDHDSNMLVFLETCRLKCGFFALPEFYKENDVIIFFKYYDPATEVLTYCGHAYIGRKSDPSSFFPMLCKRAGLPDETQLMLYEEISVGRTDRIICKGPVFDEAVPDLMDGDIICFQKFEKNLKQFRLPTPIEYFKQKSVQQKWKPL